MAHRTDDMRNSRGLQPAWRRSCRKTRRPLGCRVRKLGRSIDVPQPGKRLSRCQPLAQVDPAKANPTAIRMDATAKTAMNAMATTPTARHVER